MSTRTNPYTEVLQQANDVAVKTSEAWSRAMGDIVAQVASTPRNFDPAAWISTVFAAHQRVLDLQHEVATELLATTSSALKSSVNAVSHFTACKTLRTKKN
jgi:predicted outer membrane protein